MARTIRADQIKQDETVLTSLRFMLLEVELLAELLTEPHEQRQLLTILNAVENLRTEARARRNRTPAER